MIGAMLSSARYERVLRLLDQERRVILNGPLSELGALVAKREALLGELIEQENDLPQAFLAAIKARAERNSRLILASIAGVKSAEAEIARIDDARDRLRTYAADGSSVDVAAARVTHDTRA